MNLASKKDIFLYVLLLAGLIAAKLYHREADTKDLFWIIQPTVWLVSQWSGLNFEMNAAGEFVNIQQNILIDKSCSGMNFMLICMCVLSFSYLPGLPNRLLYFGIFLGSSYGFTVMVNSFRIIEAIWIQEKWKGELPFTTGAMHEMLGILVYVFFLLVFFGLSRYIFKSNFLKAHEKTV